jgi:hypothetical protein
MSGIQLFLSYLVLLAPGSSTTPESVWAGFDPRHEPLEIETLNRWSEHGARYTEFTFTGMTIEGSKVRVYAISSASMGKKNLPGVLHIHGGGQTVNPAWLRFWNDRGYAALTFNWGGEWRGWDKFTDWGKRALDRTERPVLPRRRSSRSLRTASATPNGADRMGRRCNSKRLFAHPVRSQS